MAKQERPAVLTISHADTSGRAGIAVDLELFAARGVRGLTAITRLSAPTPSGRLRAHPVPPRFVATQIDAAVREARLGAVKVGLLGSWQMVTAVAGRARRRRFPNVVLDAQMHVPSGAEATVADGDRELGARGAELLRRHLLPLARAVIVTRQEAEWLTGVPARDPEGLRAAAEALKRAGVGAVFIPGWDGDLPGLWYDGSAFYELPAVGTSAGEDRGGRDRFSAALAASLALGETLPEAMARAAAFLTDCGK